MSWLLPAALLLLLPSCVAADSSLDRVRESGVLRIGLDPTYPPFELADDDGLSGLDVELAGALAAALGAEPAFSYFGYDGLYDALLTEQVDVLLSALVISPERTRDFAYSRPYYDAGQVLVVPVDSPIAGTDDLDGRRLAVELGALGHVEAQALAHDRPRLTVVPLGSTAEALAAVGAGSPGALGSADAALVDSISARLFLRDQPTGAPALRLIDPPVSSEPFAAVVRIEDEALLAAIDAELARLAESGELAALIGRWVGP